MGENAIAECLCSVFVCVCVCVCVMLPLSGTCCMLHTSCEVEALALALRGDSEFKHFADSKVKVTFLLLHYLGLAPSFYQSIDLAAER